MPFKRPACLASPDYQARNEVVAENEDLQLVPARCEDIPEEERGSCQVNLMKRDGETLGLTVSGGVDRDGRAKVSNLRSTGIAAKCDLLQTGDFITSVNGIRTHKLKHGEIISLLKNIGERVTLEIEYELPPISVTTHNIVQKQCEVTMRRDAGGMFGFVLRGGNHDQHYKSRPLVVTHIRDDSSADREGSLKTGDRILSVDSQLLSNCTLEEAIDKLRHHPADEATFTVEYDVSVMESVTNMAGPLLVEVFKTPRAELGISLSKSSRGGRSVICVDRVKPASIADRCGALHAGDQIISIDGVALTSSRTSSVGLRDATELLHSSSDQIKLEILPLSKFQALTAPRHLGKNRYAASITSSRSLSSFPMQSTHLPPHHHTMTHDRMSGRRQHRSRRHQQYRSAMSLVVPDQRSNQQVVHSETCMVRLRACEDSTHPADNQLQPNFGVQLLGGVFTTEILGSLPVVGAVDHDRPAHRSGVIQAGDRLISINGFDCEEYTLDEVNQMIAEAYHAGQVEIEVEFDVADSIVPSSGIFHAKLHTRRGIDLGIDVGDVDGKFMISRIKPGSVAHRSGTLQIGDHVLAIDDVIIDHFTGAEYARSLLRDADDVVRLKIQKNEDNSDDDDGGSVSYTVELKRRGGPLGVTISGTENPFDPIVISQLTPQGLAARTGAIHKGDRITCINKQPLRGLTLTHAIELLRNAGEVVTLKIRRSDVATFSPPSRQRVTSRPLSEDLLHASEPSDPEDDILPPPMCSIDRPTDSPTPQLLPHNKERGQKSDGTGAGGQASMDSAVDSWEGSSSELQALSSGDRMVRGESPNLFNSMDNLQLSQQQTHDRPQSHVSRFSSIGGGNKQSTTSQQHQARNQQRQPSSCLAEDHSRQHQHRSESGSRSYCDTWDTTSSSSHRSRTRNKTTEKRPPLPLADWQRALDDLQSVGQSSEYIRDLETKLGPDDVMMTSSSSTSNRPRSQQPTRNNADVMTSSRADRVRSSPAAIIPLKFHKIVLCKERLSEDFGFSVADGQVEQGVFVHTVREAGPASRSGLLAYDRILQVNGSSVSDCECRVIALLISGSQARLTLFVSRSSHKPVLAPPLSVANVHASGVL